MRWLLEKKLDQTKFEESNYSSKTSTMGDSIVYCYLEDIQYMPKKTSRHMGPGSLDYASRTFEFLLSHYLPALGSRVVRV